VLFYINLAILSGITFSVYKKRATDMIAPFYGII